MQLSGIRGSALSPSLPDKGGAQFQGRGVSQGTLHPEGHFVAASSGCCFHGKCTIGR